MRRYIERYVCSKAAQEMEFFGQLHKLSGADAAHAFRRLVECVEWGPVAFDGFRCFAVVMERGIVSSSNRFNLLKKKPHLRLECIEDVLAAILVLHDLKYIHDDIKLDNVVYFGEEAGYKLIDFDYVVPGGTHDPPLHRAVLSTRNGALYLGSHDGTARDDVV
ncbi:Aste57867_10808 [Aphanomyces stellatus]|uniref:Aste57867_10808 protein n=1 Tax=Aphanomyces stellatus TaxID=120398 RepID=A0A485KRF8_9STRA|nr:hypothetical protein As57867_010768 [Aphanomyces stellatus]VFT87677.1 Aste57867_10808 [Aphanomyces stellatus]